MEPQQQSTFNQTDFIEGSPSARKNNKSHFLNSRGYKIFYYYEVSDDAFDFRSRINVNNTGCIQIQCNRYHHYLYMYHVY